MSEITTKGSEGLVFNAPIHTRIAFITMLLLVPVSTVLAQEPAGSERPARESPAAERQPGQQRTVGTVTSIGRASIVVRTDQGMYMVYSVDRFTAQPRPVMVGTRVAVVSASNDLDDAPAAISINLLPRAQGLAESAREAEPDNVPPEVQRLETQVERAARRYRLGVQVGAALDPELISLDAFTTFAPVISRNLAFRPNVELAFGELTTLFGIHLDGIYMLPGFTRSTRWAPYVGGGPEFEFGHKSLEATQVDGETIRRFDFSDWTWNNGVNFIVGARSPNGVHFEMKSTAWGAANIRLLGGFEF
jgi:hypothetical protein